MQNEDQLKDLARQIRDWQSARQISDTELCRQYGGLGSTKTYKRILEADFDELNLERQLHNYRQVWALIEAATAKEQIEEKDYPDLDHVEAVRLAVTDAQGEAGNNRLVIAEGASGTGKTTIRRCLERRWPNITVVVEADETMRESVHNTLGAILRAVGTRERRSDGDNGKPFDVALPNSSEERKLKLIEVLNAKKRILIIDEAHHLGVRTLNLVKTLLNTTPTIVVFLAIPTLLRRLETTAYEEARQLTRNRLCERIHIDSPAAGQVALFLDRRQVEFTDKKTAHDCAGRLAEVSIQYGHWNFVNLVARRARRACAKEGPLDKEQFVEAVVAAQKTR